jgi:hypothetical protein
MCLAGVYLLKHGSRREYKIGRTNNPVRREGEMDAGGVNFFLSPYLLKQELLHGLLSGVAKSKMIRMNASFPHFCATVARIQENSWWAANFGPGKFHCTSFTYSFPSGEIKPEIPTEPLESLLLHVRKLTMDSSENMLNVRKALKSLPTHDTVKNLLTVWHKWWRLAFIKEPFEIQSAGVKQVMTPYKVYDCFVNGQLFHTNNPDYNIILYGNQQPTLMENPHSFLRWIFYSVVVNLCLAALGLKHYMDNKEAPTGFVLAGYHPSVFEYVIHRNAIKQMDEQYNIFSRWVEEHGGCRRGRWGN